MVIAMRWEAGSTLLRMQMEVCLVDYQGNIENGDD